MIRVEGVSKKFEDFIALDSVSCEIKDGCIYGMVGSNGAGKSTFLRVLSGIYKPEQGEVLVDGEPIYENPRIKKQMVFVTDELFFLPGANMKKMAQYYASIYEAFSYKKFEELTHTFGLDPKKNVSTFSKGMRRQASIILALSTNAKYMYFDETFDGLDPVMRNLVKKLICGEVVDKNSTIIVTSHSLRELEDLCDHLALLHKGGMVLDSDVLDLKTSQFKVQIAFREEFNKEKFLGFPITRYRQEASVANMIINGDREQMVARLKEMQPIVLDVLPLTLEEVFMYEMEALGYAFEDMQNEKEQGGSSHE